ncbi:prephenate dehydrogenase [Prosthecobacter fusiformis]|uniref:Prephenate dehydrogenase n=1 Tax=Prosthecobacter fusiformis TaxID=48464 RepID=A0A4R7SRG6_9BACT|nr:prephenate dehydrogenase/arogenate dehydrogenase family protein [Prosthecobacter fusiformis]TDU81199.1 prephenate dehydrogenase [Prosthecobacter fusiformis]
MSSETTIAIYGPGLLGGSLALAIQERLPGSSLRLWARRESAQEAILARGIQAEFYTDATAAATGASLIILCTPVETMPALAAQIAMADLSPDTLITDVGSVKGSVVRALDPILGPRFIGSHPMAGSEKAGIETARASLFQNATCLITPGARTPPSASSPEVTGARTPPSASSPEVTGARTPPSASPPEVTGARTPPSASPPEVTGARTPPSASSPEVTGARTPPSASSPEATGARTTPSASPLTRLRTFWQTLGCNVLEMSPDEHDEKVARISHLPHMMAAVTTLAALRTDPTAVSCVANGFRDTTRVAGGDPGLWTGIALENRTALLSQLQAASATLTELLEILGKPDEEELRRFLAEAQTLRRTVPAAVS